MAPAHELPIDAEKVLQLAQLGCKTREIAAFFGCSHDTITRRFASELEKGRADLQMSLRQWQLKSAKDGNVVMQIWLGKQILSQQDKQEIILSKIDNEAFIEEAQRRLIDASQSTTDSGTIDQEKPQD